MHTFKTIPLLWILIFSFGIGLSQAQARDYIAVVGSSTVYPFATVVAEQFGKTTQFKTPKIEATGSGGGLKLFCSGVGVEFTDMTNASRRIKKSEVEQCDKNGVKDIIEIKIGYDGIVLANSKKVKPLQVTRKEIFLALAKEVPDPKGGASLIPNPYSKWSDINAGLPDIKIEVLGPPPTSGTRDAFMELVMETGAEDFGWIKALSDSDKSEFKKIAHTMREDGPFVEAGENDNLIVQKLDVNPDAVGIFGFSFLDQNTDKIQGALIDGVEPTFEAIAEGQYPVSRPLYLYVKKAHAGVIPGFNEFLNEFTSEKAWGEDGYLADKGMIPMPDEERAAFREDAQKLNPLTLK
ncbi:MAG: phosphate ABC transporter substrate-binding protein [Desulfobulbaceae bacterium]|nr:MAG: phosphate ABC transporter substrate-binding protein [Desulfobulbaceae bacterium]